MLDALRAYRDGGYQGVLIPDHTPHTTCAAPWHAGMAFALGYIRSAMNMLAKER
jgi:mannonate dehydratase